MNERLSKILNFLKEIEKLKLIERIPYLSNQTRQENDAEHTWHLAMMLLALEKEIDLKFDVLKTLKIILIHDIVEIHTGDSWVVTKAAKNKKHNAELESAKKIFSLLPDDLEKEFMSLWLEYEAGKTKEAKIAKALDKINYALQFSISKKIEWPEPHDRQVAVDYAAPHISFDSMLIAIHEQLLDDIEK